MISDTAPASVLVQQRPAPNFPQIGASTQAIPTGKRVASEVAAMRLEICRKCEKRRVAPTGIEWCDICGSMSVHRDRQLGNLVPYEESLPGQGCKHPQRRDGKGWPLPAPSVGTLTATMSRIEEAPHTPAVPSINPPTGTLFLSGNTHVRSSVLEPVNVLQQPPLVFTAENKPVNLEGFYRGRSCFLICGGPSFGRLDHSQLRRPGIITMGVNNTVRTYRPHLWVCADTPEHFLRSIWLDPTIIKFAPITHADAQIFDSDRWQHMPLRIAKCPAAFFYHRNTEFNAERFLIEPTINWGNDNKRGGARSVMLPAIRLLYHLGIRRIFLLGCDFKMATDYRYHFGQERDSRSIHENNYGYRVLRERFKQLRPVFEAAGLRVYNCSPESKLDAFEKISFDQAVAKCLEEWGNINVANERAAGLYDRRKETPQPAQPVRNRFWHPKPVIPPLAHFVWLGSPLPKMADDFIDRFAKLNPGLKVKLWTKIPANMPATLRAAAKKVPQLCQQSDLVRLWVLYKHGGIYLDTDFYFLRSVEELRHYENFILQGTDPRLFNGVMGFAKSSPVLHLLLQEARVRVPEAGPGMIRTYFGPKLFTDFHREHPGQLNVLPTHYFYIIHTQGTALKFIKASPGDQTRMIDERRCRMVNQVQPFAIHLWGFPADAMGSQFGRSSFARTQSMVAQTIPHTQHLIGDCPIVHPTQPLTEKISGTVGRQLSATNDQSLVPAGSLTRLKATTRCDDPVGTVTGRAKHSFVKARNRGTTKTSKELRASTTVISFYTRGTPYENDAASLATSAAEQGFDVKLYSINNTGIWESNCAKKAGICLQALSTLRSPILCLDADCWLKRSLPLFQGRARIKHDIMCEVVPAERLIPPMEAVKHRGHAYTYGGMWNSGVLYFNYSPDVLEFVAEWEAACRANPDMWDQIVLQQLYVKNADQNRISHKALPDEYYAGRMRIGHRSGFHLHWGRGRPQKWLLLGSAPYIQDWWGRYGRRYVDAGFIIAAMNNAWRVPGRCMNVWFRPNDFKPGRSKRELPPAQPWYFEQPDGWNTKPCWEREGRLSFLDSCYHVLNTCCTNSRTIELHVAGSDFIYAGRKTHFYGRGGPDPLRYGTEFLDRALLRLKLAYESKGCRIVNASDQSKSRLPFERHILGRF